MARPSWLTSNGFDTNVTRGGLNPISSYEFFTIPQLDTTYTAETFTVNGTLAGEFAYTPGEVTASKKTNFNHLQDVSLQWAKTVLRPSFLLARRNTYARPDFDVGRKSQRIAGTMDFGLEFVPGGRLRTAGGFTRDQTRYVADQVFRGVPLNETLNFNVYTPRLSTTYKLTSNIEAGAGLELTHERFLLSPARDGDGSRVYGILNVSTPARVFAALNIGARRFQPKRLPAQVFNGTYIRGVTGFEVGRTTLAANVTRDIGFSYDSGRGYFVATTGVVNVRRQLSMRLDIEAETTLMRLTYHPLDVDAVPVRDLRRLDGLLALGFRLKPWLKVGSNIERETASGSEVWNAWRFTAYTIYGLKRIRKLDRPLPR